MGDDPEDIIAPEVEEEDDQMAAMLDLSKKKKKKKKKKDESAASTLAGDVDGITADGDATGDDDQYESQRRLQREEDASQIPRDVDDPYDRRATYTYDELLDRVIRILHEHNPALVQKKRRNMKPPQLTRLGAKKTLWVNFQEICTMMQRSPEHVFHFFMAELGTEGSIDGNQRLVIKGKYLPKYIESLLRKYIVEYVTCRMCRSPNTELNKDSVTRLFFCNCKDCGSSRSVAPIRSGYHATSRADRRAARNTKA